MAVTVRDPSADRTAHNSTSSRRRKPLQNGTFEWVGHPITPCGPGPRSVPDRPLEDDLARVPGCRVGARFAIAAERHFSYASKQLSSAAGERATSVRLVPRVLEAAEPSIGDGCLADCSAVTGVCCATIGEPE